MKKSIYTNLKREPKIIWRNNTVLKITPGKTINEMGWTDAQKLEYQFNNKDEYILGDIDYQTNFNFPVSILEEFPEYLAGWKTIITNTGLIAFQNKEYTDEGIFNNTYSLVIYDMFDDDVTPDGPDTDSSFLSDIKPDISMLKVYNMFDQPLSVRKINFTNSEFTPERSYVYDNKWCGFFNCDGVNNNTTLNDNFFFEFESDKPDIENIQFSYKPLFVFKIYNTDGSKKISSDLKILIDGKKAEADSEGGFYFIDLSDYKIENRSLLPLQISISLQDCGNGYLEVI